MQSWKNSFGCYSCFENLSLHKRFTCPRRIPSWKKPCRWPIGHSSLGQCRAITVFIKIYSILPPRPIMWTTNAYLIWLSAYHSTSPYKKMHSLTRMSCDSTIRYILHNSERGYSNLTFPAYFCKSLTRVQSRSYVCFCKYFNGKCRSVLFSEQQFYY